METQAAASDGATSEDGSARVDLRWPGLVWLWPIVGIALMGVAGRAFGPGWALAVVLLYLSVLVLYLGGGMLSPKWKMLVLVSAIAVPAMFVGLVQFGVGVFQHPQSHPLLAAPRGEVTRDDVVRAVERGLPLRGAMLDGLDLSGVDLAGVDLAGASMRNVVLRDADLRDSALRGADLSRARLEGACLDRADLAGAIVHGANVSGAHLRDTKAPEVVDGADPSWRPARPTSCPK